MVVCHRCAGIYLGAAMALPLLPLMRFRPTRTLRAFHALLMLQMVLLGLHLVPHPPTVAMLSGQLFAMGAAYFVWDNLRLRWKIDDAACAAKAYMTSLVLSAALLVLLTHAPWPWMATVLNALVTTGFLAIVAGAGATALSFVPRK